MLYPPRSVCSPPSRVVVTGTGIVTPLGIGWAANNEAFRHGHSAIRRVTQFDVTRQRSQLAGEVDLPPQWDQPLRASRTRTERWDRALSMLWLAGSEAWQQAGWLSPHDIPLILGTTSAGMSQGEDFYNRAELAPDCQVGQSTRVLYYQAQRQVAEFAQVLGAQGPQTIVSNACASGANALGQAWQLLRTGRYPRALAGGYEALSRLVFAGFDSLQALSPTVCRPFDRNRDGLTLGEGAAVVALETLESAQERRALILGELESYASSTDTHHLTQPHPNGDAALAAMHRATSLAGLEPSDIQYLNAHGTGTRLNDEAEARAIHAWADNVVDQLQVSSTKRLIGHLLGAAGAVEAVLCLMALRGQWLPPMPELQDPDPLCTFRLVQQPMPAQLERVMSNSFGFGGANATLIFRRYEDQP